jgi:hypothetical protein
MLLLEPTTPKKSMADSMVMRSNNVKNYCRMFDAPV